MNTKPFSRVERVEQELLKIINQILSKDIDLRKYGFLTFSSIKMTADLKHANVFYSIINPTKDIELIDKELNEMVPIFRKNIASQIKLKFMPTLRFIYDNSFEEFEKITGVGALMNTSFNIHGESIVGTPHDAIDTFLRCGLDHLFIGSWLISKTKN